MRRDLSVVRRARARWGLFAAATLASVLACPERAFAQNGFALDRFDPAPVGSEWFQLDSLDMRGELRPAIGFTTDYAFKPLVLFTANNTQIPIVRNQFFFHGSASLVMLDRLRFALDVPGAVYEQGASGTLGTGGAGTALTAPNSPAFGDIRLDGDIRVAGTHDDPFTLAIGSQFFLPSGSRALYAGDGGLRVAPHILAAGEIGIFAYAASVGVMIHGQHDPIAPGVPVGGELQLGGAMGLLLADKKLLLGPEIWGRTDVTDKGAAFTKNESPIEWLMGGHLTLDSWRLGLGGGTGFAQGLGSPELRILASIAFVPPPSQPPEDRDHDGILDKDDACPDVKGVKTDDPKTNGCPPPEPPPEPPPPPAEPPPPDPDRDKDGILNEVDACPDVPGEPNPDPKKNGCPKAVVQEGKIQILDQVKFATDRADILPESDAILSAVLKILTDHPEITKVEVEGHTDNTGGTAHNQTLSEKRAASVVHWLVDHGVARERLTSQGFGQSRPIDTNTTDAGKKNNRRVEFHILEGAVAGPVSSAPTPKPPVVAAVEETPKETTKETPPKAEGEKPADAKPKAEEGAAAEGKPKGGGGKKKGKKKKGYALDFDGAAMGVADTNTFDKGANTVQALGLDANVGLGLSVPVSKRVSWIAGTGLGTNYRGGVNGSVGDANSLRVDANVKTGLEFLVLGKSDLPGRKVKKPKLPALKLGIEAKYALWSNPLLGEKVTKGNVDETVDALESGDDEGDSGDSGGAGEMAFERHHRSHPGLLFAEGVEGDGGDGASDEGSESADPDSDESSDEGGEDEGGEPADIPIGSQTFSNPNTHHHISGTGKAILDITKKLSLTGTGGGGHDFVNLDDNVEVNPQYTDVTASFAAKYKVNPKLFWVTLTYNYERRFYDDVSAKGATQDFETQGFKVGIDIPLKPVKLKVSYDIRLKLPDSGSSGNTTRHQIQAGAEIPIKKYMSAVVEERFTDTLFSGDTPSSLRSISLAGLKFKF